MYWLLEFWLVAFIFVQTLYNTASKNNLLLVVTGDLDGHLSALSKLLA